MTSAAPDEGRTTPDLSSWREFAIDGEFCVAEARLETQESLDQYTPAAEGTCPVVAMGCSRRIDRVASPNQTVTHPARACCSRWKATGTTSKVA